MASNEYDISFKSAGIKTTDPYLKVNSVVTRQALGIKTPLEIGSGRSNLFRVHFDMGDQVSDNLRNLILTNHGERLGNQFYGANLRPLLTELAASDGWDSEAMTRITMSVKKYMPNVVLNTFTSDFHKISTSDSKSGVAEIQMTIKFSVPELKMSERALQITMFVVG